MLRALHRSLITNRWFKKLEYFLYVVFFLSCIVLFAAVLLQPGKTDAGALFTSNVSSSAFSPRGTATVLSKVTIVAAATFMLSALFLAMPAFTGNVSVLSSNPDAPADTSANTNSNTADTNANTAPPIDANTISVMPPIANTPTEPAANIPVANAPAANVPPANTPAKNVPAKAAAKK